MKSTTKNLVAIFLCVLFTFAFVGCEKNNENDGSDVDAGQVIPSETPVAPAQTKAPNSNTEIETSEREQDADVSAPYENANSLIDEKTAQYADSENPVAIIVMESGECIVLELYRATAPKTVDNYISLANSGFYDGLTFHRIDPKFMIQGGDPLGNGTGGPGYQIFGEFTNNGFQNDLSHKRGVISMARRSDGNDTAGSQFFICVKDSEFLDGNYAAFGKVLEGMDVVDGIANAKANGERPVSPRVMQTVRVAEKGTIIDPAS